MLPIHFSVMQNLCDSFTWDKQFFFSFQENQKAFFYILKLMRGKGNLFLFYSVMIGNDEFVFLRMSMYFVQHGMAFIRFSKHSRVSEEIPSQCQHRKTDKLTNQRIY